MGGITAFSFLCVAIIAIAAAQRKAGDCPPPTDAAICSITCQTDVHCQGRSKCCRTSCGGSVCLRPVTARKLDGMKDKPGNCPVPSGPWVCSSRCSFDGDCRGKNKCCKNRCGAQACMKPEGL